MDYTVCWRSSTTWAEQEDTEVEERAEDEERENGRCVATCPAPRVHLWTAGNLPGFPRFFALGNLIPLLMFMP